MERLYYLVPSKERAQEIIDDLHGQGVSDPYLHLMDKNCNRHCTHKLNASGVLSRTDLIRYLERGSLTGAVVGAALVAMLLLLGLVLPAVAWVSMFLFSMVAGAWLGGIVATSFEDHRSRRLDGELTAGRCLLEIDVPKHDAERVREHMRINHPGATLQTMAAFPKRATPSPGH